MARSKYLICFSLFMATVLFAASVCSDDGFYAFPFIGRWQPSADPIAIDEYGYQDIQNLRRNGNTLRAVRGHTYINTSAFDSTYYYPNAIFHYRKASPAESHIIIHGSSSEDAATGRWEAKSIDIPDTGEFTGTVTHSDATGAINPMFVQAPDGALIYCNSKETKVWGGDEYPILSFVTSLSSDPDASLNLMEWIHVVRDQIDGEDSSAQIDATYGRVFFVGTPYIINGVKFYVDDANTTSSSMSVDTWTVSGFGGSWTSVSGLSDGTSSGGVSLAQDGSITWTTPATSQRYLYDYVMYWYRFTLSAGDARISYATSSVPVQDLKNIWDGAMIPVAAAYDILNGATASDYTVLAQADDELSVWPWDSLDTGNSVAFGFTEPVMGIFTKFAPGKENSNSVGGRILMRPDGGNWTVITAAEGNLIESPAANSSGVTHWHRIPDSTERPLRMAFGSIHVESPPQYYYRYGTTSPSMDAEVEASYVAGIPKTELMKDYAIPVTFRNRLFLLNEIDGDRNKALYSSYGTSYVFNGSDSGILEFGDKEEITGAGVIFNMFQSEGYEQLLVMKSHRTYRVIELSSGALDVQQLNDVYGCVSPRSVAACSITASRSEDARKQVLVWVSSSGVVASDGGSVWLISGDISQYWDEEDGDYIDPSDMAMARAVYDPNLNAYKLFVDDLELEYSFASEEWTKILRERYSGPPVNSAVYNQLKAACVARDTDGRAYVYGASNTGIVYRTETGESWVEPDSFNSRNVRWYVHTKDVMLDKQAPMFYDTLIHTFRFLYRGGEDGDDGTIAFNHYCDGNATTDGADDQEEPPNAAYSSLTDAYTSDVNLGRCRHHSWLIEYDISDEDYNATFAVPVDILGLGCAFESFDVIEE